MACHWVDGDPEVARDLAPPPLRRLDQSHCELATGQFVLDAWGSRMKARE
jgi:hypothetical protein